MCGDGCCLAAAAAGLLLRGDGADEGEGGLLAGSSYRGGHSPLRLQQQLSMVVKPQLSALSSASSSASTVLLTHQQQQPVARFHYPSPHLAVTQLPASLMS